MIATIDNLKFEKELYEKNITLIAGVDEVGRGPLVGPVVASAVILPKNYIIDGLTDSKKLSEKKRSQLFEEIINNALSVGIGIVDAKTIDEINILEASKLAMIQAIEKLNLRPNHLLIDGNQNLNIAIPQTTIIKGDYLSQSIAAASVIAKVTRDKMMYELDELYPEYEFKSHKGYPTKKHIANIEKYGVLKNYRFSYAPVKEIKKRRDDVN